jgi:hypothetical protein
MKSLPRAPTSYCRGPFSTTCIPIEPSPLHTSSSSSKPPFPISRFASAPSLTPSKWKNRDDSARPVDPEILPYLDSVPIRLLPLLPPSAESSEAGTPASGPVPESSSERTAAAAAPVEPTQPSEPVPPMPSSTTSSNPPLSVSIPSLSTSSASQSTPTRRKPNFSFVPLLPVPEVKVAPEAPVLSPPPPAKRFNMTFVPLLPPEEPSKPPSAPSTAVAADLVELTPRDETPVEEDIRHSEPEVELTNSPPSTYMTFNLHRSYTSTPSLCSASDTDTESETPSVSSPSPSSPAESDLAQYFESRPHAEVLEGELRQQSVMANHNPYFPALIPGGSILPHVLAEAPVVRKLQLEALPSPALQPPSPFSLDAPGLDEAEDELVKSGVQTMSRGSPIRGGTLTRRTFIPRPSSLSSLSSLSQGQAALDAVSESLSALATTVPPAFSPALDTPELTIESMRAPSYVRIPEKWRRAPGAIDGEGILEPSIRRRD